MAISELYYSLTGNPKKEGRHSVYSHSSFPRDDALEKRIEEAGRDEVLSRARSLGWTNELPPKCVWYGIANEILGEKIAKRDT